MSGAQTIKHSEIKAYLDMWEINNKEEREEFIYIITELDGEYIRYTHEKGGKGK